MSFAAVGLVLTVASTLYQGYATGQQAKYAAEVQNQQAKIEIANEKIKAMQQQSDRQAEYLKMDSANRVAIAFSGASQNISFDQGIGPENLRTAKRDMNRIAYNSEQEVGRLRYEIKVNRATANLTARNAMVGSFLDAGAQAAVGIQKMKGSYGA